MKGYQTANSAQGSMKLPEVVLRKSVITFFHTNNYNSAFTVMREVVKTGLQKCPRVIDELTVHFNDDMTIQIFGFKFTSIILNNKKNVVQTTRP